MVTNRVVFLTGAASGIGYEMGNTFAKEGAKVVITDRLEDRAKEAAEQLQKKAFKLSVYNVTLHLKKKLQ